MSNPTPDIRDILTRNIVADINAEIDARGQVVGWQHMSSEGIQRYVDEQRARREQYHLESIAAAMGVPAALYNGPEQTQGARDAADAITAGILASRAVGHEMVLVGINAAVAANDGIPARRDSGFEIYNSGVNLNALAGNHQMAAPQVSPVGLVGQSWVGGTGQIRVTNNHTWVTRNGRLERAELGEIIDMPTHSQVAEAETATIQSVDSASQVVITDNEQAVQVPLELNAPVSGQRWIDGNGGEWVGRNGEWQLQVAPLARRQGTTQPSANQHASWALWSDTWNGFITLRGGEIVAGGPVPVLKFATRMSAESFRLTIASDCHQVVAVQVQDPWYEIEASVVLDSPFANSYYGVSPAQYHTVRLIGIASDVCLWSRPGWAEYPAVALATEEAAAMFLPTLRAAKRRHRMLAYGVEANCKLAAVAVAYCQNAEFYRPISPITDGNTGTKQLRAIEMRD